MKSQINHLKSGKWNQLTQAGKIDRHNEQGSNNREIKNCFDQIYKENKNRLRICILGNIFSLKLNMSVSKKSKAYLGSLTAAQIALFGLTPAKNKTGSIIISDVDLAVTNGKNGKVNISPELVCIL